MNKILLVLSFMSIAFAHSALNRGFSKTPLLGESTGGGSKDGRGVGGGYGGHVNDAFIGVGSDIIRIIMGDIKKESDVFGSPYARVPGDESLLVDLQRIQEFLEGDNISVVPEGHFAMSPGASYAIYEGRLYLNVNVWDQKLLKGSCEEEIIRILLSVTEQEDEDGKLAKKLAELLAVSRENNTRLEDQKAQTGIFD